MSSFLKLKAMIEYIKNILPRLKAFSQKVNQKEQLVDKTWVWVGFAEEFSTIHFLRDQRLLVTKLGNVQEGKWEFIGNELIHLSGEGFNIMLNHGILFGGLLVIQKQGVLDHLEVLYDQIEIPDGDVVKYIEAKLLLIESQPVLREVYPYTIHVDAFEITFSRRPLIGSFVTSLELFSGKVEGLPNNLRVEIIDNMVTRVYYFAVAETNAGFIEMEIENCDWENPKGKCYFQLDNSIPDGEFTIISMKPKMSWKRIVLRNGEIDFVGSWSKDVLTALIILLVTGIAVLIIGMQ
jgi:hypothetical protein